MRSRPFSVRVRGELACFTRPEMKAERVSYEVMTPSAACGVLKSILWKPAIRWSIEEIAVLAPIRWFSIVRNEVRDCASPRVPYIVADDHDQRSQRHTLMLRDVDYVVKCFIELTEYSSDRNIKKYEEMFIRRLELGQCFEMPYLGMREFVADVRPAPETYTPIDPGVDRPLGLMFYDFTPTSVNHSQPAKPLSILNYDLDNHVRQALFYHARMRSGRIQVPPLSMVLDENGVRKTA
jgi:CRISPR-associated protein Cas5d